MANRRMFAKTIIDSDAFLDMPLSTQSLYFHLSMRADDDGFVNNPKKISRMIGCGEDDLKLLIGKRFLLYFESGVVVIKHWLIHNTIRKDRKIPTNYQDEFKQLDEKDNGSYRKTNDTNALDRMDVTPQPNDNQVATSCQHSVVEFSVLESSVVKDSVIKTSPPSVSESELKSDFEQLWTLYPNKKGKAKAFTAYKKAIKSGVTNKDIQTGIQNYKNEIQANRTEVAFIAYGSTWFNNKRWEDEAPNIEHTDLGHHEDAPTDSNEIIFDDDTLAYVNKLIDQGKKSLDDFDENERRQIIAWRDKQ